MRYFIDTEFIERGAEYPIELISIGIVAEDGRELYIINNNYHKENCSAWVKENVIPYLGNGEYLSFVNIKNRILEFIDDTPEFWGYYSDYDWVVFCQIFGNMIDLPKGWPMFCNDLKQWCNMLGNPKLPKQVTKEHNALEDARWNKEVYKFLDLYNV